MVVCCLAVLLATGLSARGPERAAAQLDLSQLLEILQPQPRSQLADGLSRVISARVRHTRLVPIQRSNARKIGRKLASFRPTWVTGTLRYARNQYPKRNEVRAWEEIRRIVRDDSPSAQFDVVLNALQYRTPASIQRTMARMRAKLGPEGWFFDFFSTAFRKNPKAVDAAIADAHAHGEWIGGNVWGLAKNRPLPQGADFLSVQDHTFRLNLPAVRLLAAQVPVLYHLNSEPHRPTSGGCRFITGLSTKRRRAFVRKRAGQQVTHGFRMSYPVFFPQCIRPRKGARGRTFLGAYNAFRDPPMPREIRRLLDAYDFDPQT
jgi:hypothetical protein